MAEKRKTVEPKKDWCEGREGKHAHFGTYKPQPQQTALEKLIAQIRGHSENLALEGNHAREFRS